MTVKITITNENLDPDSTISSNYGHIVEIQEQDLMEQPINRNYWVNTIIGPTILMPGQKFEAFVHKYRRLIVSERTISNDVYVQKIENVEKESE